METVTNVSSFTPNTAEQVQQPETVVAGTVAPEQYSQQPTPKQQPAQDAQVQATTPVSVPPPIPVQTMTQPVAPIFSPKKEEKKITTIEAAESRANEVVAEVFGQAVVHTVVNDEGIQEKLLNTAQSVVENKAEVLANRAEQESKASFIDKHSDACFYFGYDDKTTSKFHVKMMAAWIFFLNTIYICTIGFLIVAPIAFILRKIKVVIKKTWVAVLLALLVYFLILAIPILVDWLAGFIPNRA